MKTFIFYFSYENITLKLKREWYNFQLETNALVNDLFGEEEDADEKDDDVEYFSET